MRWLYVILLTLTSMLWGGNFVSGKFVVGHADSMVLTFLRWGIASLVLLPFVWMKEKRIIPPKSAWLALIVMGLTGVILFNLFMFWALERTSATNTGLLSTLNPLSIVIFSFLLLKESIRPRQVAAMIISLFGVLIVLTEGHLEYLLQLNFNVGDLYMLVAVATWGVYSVAGKKALKYVSPYMSTLWSGILGTIILFPFCILHFEISNPIPSFWGAEAYISVGGTVLAMLFWNIGVQKLGGTASGMFLNLNPVFTALFAFILLGEQLLLSQVVGASVVILGVIYFNYAGKQQLAKRGKGETTWEHGKGI
ncbi:DMT family transporter [Paenibacillus sediminis]|uniref:Drug/metabolite transporter (DMT)-like permease n=1 Tax=Paenibacillus sediminis TaxID=664909 RepID=A0ABS4H055_9BACL|nr:DMT family transporter [Paenibacillus sediminis]MBP1935899.1 drug/metabolite transporter (DMT)-like permease [Paenibacillus sediminis]